MTETVHESAAGQLAVLLSGLNAEEREDIARDLLRMLRQRSAWNEAHALGAAGDVPQASSRSVELCHWADDAGQVGNRQRLEVEIAEGLTKIAKTSAATGRALLTNGFLGADIIHVPAGSGFAPHTHPGDHLLFVIGGRGTITANGEILETAPGHVYMVDGLATHAVGAITDHVLLSIGAPHRALDSEERQQLRPFSDLLGPDGTIVCRICNVTTDRVEDLAEHGCPHAPVRFNG